jgi:hypothetical protein
MGVSEPSDGATGSPRGREAFTRTIPSSAFSAAGVAQSADTPPAAAPAHADPAGDGLDLSGAEIWSKLADSGLTTPRPLEQRYRIERMLGIGSTGQVYAVVDRNLERQVAIKVLNRDAAADAEGLADFISEAKITAALKHPNVLPVLDIDLTRGGRPYFSMARVDGRTLADLIDESRPTARHPRLASFNDVVSIVVDICDGVAYAHHQRIVHQDIKPENILIGDFGEVLVLDWGCARRSDGSLSATSIYGTPLYMSPEQARRESVDERSDIYCIGATLLHVLTLRPPTWHDEPEEFWRRKRVGEIDPPTEAERAAVPAELLAIALKALAPDPAHRYAAVSALRADLLAYQAGLAISAHHYTALQACARWLRRHRRAILTWSTVSAVVLALVAALWGERLKEVAAWGAPVVAEPFNDASWSARWTTINGQWETTRDGVVSRGRDGNTLLWPKRLAGATAIEYEAQMMPIPGPNGRVQPGDISLYWARDLERDPKGGRLLNILGLQIGAFDNAHSAIKDKAGHHLAYSGFRGEVGRWYRIRDEIVDNHVTVSIDGTIVLDYTDPFPLTGGFVVLYGFYPGKAFRNVRIYSLGLPRRLPPTAIGDAESQDGLYAQAADQYERVITGFPGTAIAVEAQFKEGLCWFRSGKRDLAAQAWLGNAQRGGLDPASAYGLQARLYLLETRFDHGEHDALLADLEDIYHRSDAVLRRQVAREWASFTDRVRGASPRDDALLRRYLAAHDRFLMSEPDTEVCAADSLSALGDRESYERIVRDYPHQLRQRAEAYQHLGRSVLVLREPAFHNLEFPRLMSMFECGMIEDMRREFPEAPFLQELRAFHGEGEAILRERSEPYYRALALYFLGRHDELFASYPDVWISDRAALMAGRYDLVNRDEYRAFIALAQRRYADVLEYERTHGSSAAGWMANLCMALAQVRTGDRAAAVPMFRKAIAGVTESQCVDNHVDQCIVVPWTLEHLGERGVLAPILAALTADDVVQYRLEQQPWYSAMLMLGRIDVSRYLAQPYAVVARGNAQLILALRAEDAGDRAGALARYRAWQALPRYERGSNIDPFLEDFVAWRVDELTR